MILGRRIAVIAPDDDETVEEDDTRVHSLSRGAIAHMLDEAERAQPPRSAPPSGIRATLIMHDPEPDDGWDDDGLEPTIVTGRVDVRAFVDAPPTLSPAMPIPQAPPAARTPPSGVMAVTLAPPAAARPTHIADRPATTQQTASALRDPAAIAVFLVSFLLVALPSLYLILW